MAWVTLEVSFERAKKRWNVNDNSPCIVKITECGKDITIMNNLIAERKFTLDDYVNTQNYTQISQCIEHPIVNSPEWSEFKYDKKSKCIVAYECSYFWIIEIPVEKDRKPSPKWEENYLDTFNERMNRYIMRDRERFLEKYNITYEQALEINSNVEMFEQFNKIENQYNKAIARFEKKYKIKFKHYSIITKVMRKNHGKQNVISSKQSSC